MKWKPLKDFEEFYEISEYGDIKSLERIHETFNRFGPMKRKCGGKVIKSHTVTNGYKSIELNVNKKIKKFLIHRLVFSTFCGELKEGCSIHHKDKNKKNNYYLNLEQLDHKEHNILHSHPAWNKGIKNPINMVKNAQKARLNYFLPLFEKTYLMKKTGMTNIEISKELNISTRTVIDRIKRYKEIKNI